MNLKWGLVPGRCQKGLEKLLSPLDSFQDCFHWVGPQKLKICYSRTTLRLRTGRGASPGRCAVGSWPDRARRRARVSGGTVRGRGVRPGGEGRLWKECVHQLVTSVGDRGRLILPGHPLKGCVEGATKRSPRGAKKLNPKLHASLAGSVP